MSFNLLNIDSKLLVSKKYEASNSFFMSKNPKSFAPKFLSQHSSQNSDEKPKSKKYKEYFIIEEDDKHKYKFDYDYMVSFENWGICQETKLLSEDVLNQFEQLKIVELETHIIKKRKKKAKKSSKSQSDNLSNSEPKNVIKEEIIDPKEFKKKLKKRINKKPIKSKIIKYLNMLTVENYITISNEIYEIISENAKNLSIFLDILFNKTVKEKLFINLYAKLCKDFDKKLSQRDIPKTDDENQVLIHKSPASIMRKELIDKCRQIFTIELDDKITSYFKGRDPIERDIKIKELVLGNANFIAELINIQILSKKMVFQYVDDLLLGFNKVKVDKSLKMICLEAIVILLDKFATLLKIKENRLEEEDKKKFNEKINIYIKKLEEIIDKEKDITQYIKYKIFNLKERSKNNWEQSQYEKSLYDLQKINLEEENEIGESILNIFTQEEVTAQINKDLIKFKEHIFEDKGTPSNYNWSIVENIYYENSVAQMIEGFLYSCIDFVNNKNNLNLAKDYFIEIIFYYNKSLSDKEKKEIIKKTIHLLKSSRKNSLGNLLLLDVWSVILSNLITADLFTRDDLLELKDLEKEDLKTIFIIIAKIIKEDKNTKIHYDKCKFVQQNKELYEEALKEIYS